MRSGPGIGVCTRVNESTAGDRVPFVVPPITNRAPDRRVQEKAKLLEAKQARDTKRAIAAKKSKRHVETSQKEIILDDDIDEDDAYSFVHLESHVTVKVC